MKVTCAILSGGKSRRMGRDKATIQIHEKALIAHTYEVARKVFDEIMVVSTLHDTIPGIEARIIKDVLPIPGSLTGIVSALLWSDTPYVFILGCDMPFLTEEALRHVMNENRGEAIIVPRTKAGFEPMHAIYHRSCISAMLAAIERGRMKIGDIYPLFCVRTVPDDPVFRNHGIPVFTNVNTEEDLRLAERILR
jgi:molybdopterin-guanine dinucleotide biosynthesis protein A